jgi:hypothetical protein
VQAYEKDSKIDFVSNSSPGNILFTFRNKMVKDLIMQGSIADQQRAGQKRTIFKLLL